MPKEKTIWTCETCGSEYKDDYYRGGFGYCKNCGKEYCYNCANTMYKGYCCKC